MTKFSQFRFIQVNQLNWSILTANRSTSGMVIGYPGWRCRMQPLWVCLLAQKFILKTAIRSWLCTHWSTVTLTRNTSWLNYQFFLGMISEWWRKYHWNPLQQTHGTVQIRQSHSDNQDWSKTLCYHQNQALVVTTCPTGVFWRNQKVYGRML